MEAPIDVINGSFAYIISKDPAAILSTYHESEELYVILEGPRLSNRGYGPISKGWQDFCASPIALQQVDWLEGPFVEETAAMSWVGGIIRLTVEVNERIVAPVFRASFVLTLQNGRWKIKHEHVSAAHEDPYGIGDWLQK